VLNRCGALDVRRCSGMTSPRRQPPQDSSSVWVSMHYAIVMSTGTMAQADSVCATLTSYASLPGATRQADKPSGQRLRAANRFLASTSNRRRRCALPEADALTEL
jgi:hypothetical protein